MKKILAYYIPVFIVCFMSACTVNQKTSLIDKKNHQGQVKKQTKHRHSLPDGVISADIVNNEGKLHLLTGKHHQGLKSLWYQNSINGGKSWSKAVRILDKSDLPANMQRGKDAQITAQGNVIVATWMKYVKGARFNAGPMMAVRSLDNGLTWQTAPSPPDWGQGPHGYIDMSANKDAMHAIWLDSRAGASGLSASQGLHYAKSTDGGISWQKNITLDDMSCSCCWNTIKSDREGNSYVLYRDKQPSDFSIGMINSQKTWQYLNHVGDFNWQFEGCPHIGGGLDFQYIDNQKRIHAIVGTGHSEYLGIHALYSVDGGKKWSNPTQLGDESSIHGDIASHDDGRVVAIWDMMSKHGLAIFKAESTDQGMSWSIPIQISNSQLRATHPRIVKTKQGFLALWTENDGNQQKLAIVKM